MYQKAWKMMLDARYIVIISHIFPDGDTLGSTLALYNALKENGKKAVLYNFTCKELPKSFDFLNGYSKITSCLPKEFDLVVSCDSGSFKQLGIQKGDYKLINIDHHKSNELYGDINLVEAEFSSAGLVVYELLVQNKIKITKDVANALYSSIADDTGFFRYGNLDKKVFEVVASLIEAGADAKMISENVNSRVSLSKMRLRAYMLNHFELSHNASIASIIITKDVLKKYGVTRSDTKNIISELRDLVNVKVAIMLLAQDDFIKVSLRSDGSCDVSNIASCFHGGGHKSAAGFDVKTDEPKELLNKIIEKIKGER